MEREPFGSKDRLKKGAWTALEDKLLISCINSTGEGKWTNVPKNAGLNRSGKSCRLRWMNYLRPSIKRGNISEEEEDLIIRLHKLLGNRWSLIAGRLPGRSDNEIKNYWNTILVKKEQNKKNKLTTKAQYTTTNILSSSSSHPPYKNKIALIRAKGLRLSNANCVSLPANVSSITTDLRLQNQQNSGDMILQDKGNKKLDLDLLSFEDEAAFDELDFERWMQRYDDDDDDDDGNTLKF